MRVGYELKLDNRDITKGNLMLVNKNHPLKAEIDPRRLREISPDIYLEKRSALLLGAVLEKIGAGDEIQPVSGYRTRKEQEDIYEGALASHGSRYAHTYVALPGRSEHQTGLAVDLAKRAENIDFITPDFPHSGICADFRREAVKYGFVERYPKGKETITGIGYEPWHFRYVGVPHAEIMTSLGLTLEEYNDWIKQYPYDKNPYQFCTGQYNYMIGYCPAAGEQYTEIEIPDSLYTTSGNNEDGFIVTVWQV